MGRRWLPGTSLARVQFRGRPGFALEETRPLVSPQEPPECRIGIACRTGQGAAEIPPEHRHRPYQDRWMQCAERATRQHVRRAGPHEVLAIPVSHTAGPPVLVARP